MKSYLEVSSFSYDTIGDFIEGALKQAVYDPLFLLGKAAAYVDVAYALDFLTKAQALELRTCIAVYAGCNTA